MIAHPAEYCATNRRTKVLVVPTVKVLYQYAPLLLQVLPPTIKVVLGVVWVNEPEVLSTVTKSEVLEPTLPETSVAVAESVCVPLE
jgi:hypothetical protein